MIRKLREIIKEKRRGKLRQGVVFHQDNAPAHTITVTMATFRESGFKLSPHPSCSPVLAPSDFHLLRSLKDSLRGHKFDTDENVIYATNDWCQELDKSFFLDCVKSLEHS